MFSAMLFAISIVALSQFAIYYWRAVLAGVAAQPVSDRVLAAAQVENGRLTSKHFETLTSLHDLTPDLAPSNGGLGLVRIYYKAVEGLDAFLGKKIPGLSTWSERELVLCVRYAAVMVDRRLQANLELSESLRSC